MNWVPNVLNQVNSSCHSKLKLKITNPLPHCTCLIPPAFLIFLSLSVSLLSLASSCFLLFSQDKIKIFEHELSKQRASKKQTKWPSKNHAIPLMASCQSRRYKPASGCHPFGIVMNEPASFTLLKPGATESSVGVAGAVPGLRSGSTGGCGRLVPGILATAGGGC